MPPRFRTRASIARLRSASIGAYPLWRGRLLFLVGGICVGLAAVLMARCADAAQVGFKALVGVSPLAALVVTPAGFALAALLARTVFPNSQGSGIPQVIAARHTRDPGFRHRLISLRVAFGKIVVMTLGLACGASSGREGPTVQVGAAIMAAVGRLTPDRLPGLILAGGAAGVAAAFNTPLAGIVFGIEELGRAYEPRSSGLIVAGIVAAGLTSLWLVGNYTYFGTSDVTLPLGKGWLVVVVLGAAGGFAGGVFSRLVILFARGLPGRAGRWIARHPIAFAGLCGLGVALAGLASGGSVYGTGYEEAKALLHGDSAARLDFAPLKFCATALSAISGIPGGLFAPSLAVGAGLGGMLQDVFPGVPIGALVLTGMVAYLAGVLQAPITAFVIVTEMTQDHAMMIPLMIAAVLADAASKTVCRTGLYHTLAEIMLARAEPAKDETRIEGEK
ncbi:chloride channel protein [Methylobacterium sp. E-041]|jgi:H+/Cl- antiporter ClcA|uniref:chloride channel protein n=1 Tax=unclassified Methylobacterium TaxID=2615210 RepID=UPI0011C954CE|nr:MULTISPECIES: chloride channel protein [unclassified Methylobacterium]MCJ2105721.1 chloride channel protein [Methylobacterium sp. E-041]TXN38766.1 chloride channel protein [Methylobacterium sp. WL93]TXN47002.1 chloride channel protein [Methylobacterium sp. WL119]TXN65002.1 chloride channel protein [Methylobacterium sp. WL30]